MVANIGKVINEHIYFFVRIIRWKIIARKASFLPLRILQFSTLRHMILQPSRMHNENNPVNSLPDLLILFVFYIVVFPSCRNLYYTTITKGSIF
ncbi:MAG: hypothetical protein BGP14_17180 [Sphingobacteriales bacterium 44-15]|nr:MAG: hypothetical protein BGP14_17180 [Sphingobacteriales bacterium 44-15]